MAFFPRKPKPSATAVPPTTTRYAPCVGISAPTKVPTTFSAICSRERVKCRSDMKLPHQNADIASEGFQRLEDLATAYWYSEVLFTALELSLFGLLGEGSASIDE